MGSKAQFPYLVDRTEMFESVDMRDYLEEASAVGWPRRSVVHFRLQKTPIGAKYRLVTPPTTEVQSHGLPKTRIQTPI